MVKMDVNKHPKITVTKQTVSGGNTVTYVKIENETFKLYKVTIRGGFNATSPDYHESYVVARSPNDAYAKVRKFLDDNDLCFSDERELKRVELIAECKQYPQCKTMLFVEGVDMV